MRIAACSCSLVLMLAVSVLVESDHTVDFDRAADFAAIKTFAFRPGAVSSTRPELDNTLFLKMIADEIRDALAGRGMKEVSDAPDVYIGTRIATTDINAPGGRRAIVYPPAGGRRGIVVPAAGPETIRYVEGTLVVDLNARTSGLLVWHGVFHETQDNGSKLVEQFVVDTGKLMSEYPPRKPRGNHDPKPANSMRPLGLARAALRVVRHRFRRSRRGIRS